MNGATRWGAAAALMALALRVRSGLRRAQARRLRFASYSR